MAMKTKYNPNTKRQESYEERDVDQDILAREKYDPSLRGNTKSQADVEASGGLGAVARRNRRPATDDQADGIAAVKKKKPSYGN